VIIGPDVPEPFLTPLSEPTDDQIEEACAAAHRNAAALLEEADLLRRHGHCARAYFRSHIACEELGKLPILIHAAVGRRMGQSVDWRRIDRLLRDHREKYKQVLFMDSLHGNETVRDGAEKYSADLERIRAYLDMKNATLYSFKVDDEFLAPGEAVPCKFYDSFASLARGRYGAFTSQYIELLANAGGLRAFLDAGVFPPMEAVVTLLSEPSIREGFDAYERDGDEAVFERLLERLVAAGEPPLEPEAPT
jgi:AbiV family abortive infection protein